MLKQDVSDISRLRDSNVPEGGVPLKGKVSLACAEAVEDENFLWKETEKRGVKTARKSVTREHLPLLWNSQKYI